ncbi:MAG: late competence development ComFB family protein [Pleurocapsa sp. SU_5_0]|nr:late competence development ComFB family protein [Pleurocapsa sp. SU_5_0]NJO96872.1 late competence development ComFB family protein [Pleurocapsa sp. CRU_1_2]NJR46354.1 late competence development ComFB family protein [Hyellaceae cyanobacterium CSU_1_1]
MKNSQSENDYIHRNVMELLVADEIERQIVRLPSNIKKFINPIEVATYALNRLPALYASSQQGFNKQKLKGRSEHSVKITQEVRKGLAAVQQDLLRSSTPLLSENESEIDKSIKEAKAALQELADYLPEKDLTWKNVVRLVKPILAELKEQDSEIVNTQKVKARNSNLWEDSIHKK